MVCPEKMALLDLLEALAWREVSDQLVSPGKTDTMACVDLLDL